ncbi:HNH endonuclease [Flavobacterium oreochromis]|uniref:HNH endonuclease n=1 Tax=Flavobacterium oreochromis TaxID=2906078 RepID=UPI00385D2141
MRPINKGTSPQVFAKYEDAKRPLVDRIGTYCSYCERQIATNLAIEHIFPKDDTLGYSHLRENWDNFLLACVNCNSAKKVKIINEATYLMPDRDNTFIGFEYLETGEVVASGGNPINTMAQNTIDLVDLNIEEEDLTDETKLFTALIRSGQRVQAWIQAKEARIDYNNGEVNVRRIVREAQSLGFFSIWMKVFEGVPAVRQELINNFIGTSTNCFDANSNPIIPRPANHLNHSGKV